VVVVVVETVFGAQEVIAAGQVIEEVEGEDIGMTRFAPLHISGMVHEYVIPQMNYL
jgi:hypothetical protein